MLPPKWIPATDRHLVTPPMASDWPSHSGEIGRDGYCRDHGIDDEEHGSIRHTSMFLSAVRGQNGLALLDLNQD